MPSKKHRGSVAGTLLGLLLCVSFNAAADPGNQQSLFWSIHRDGQLAGYLLGTIHSEDPRVLDFSPVVGESLARSQVYAMEMVPDLPTLAKLTEYMRYPPGKTLESAIGAERLEALTTALVAYDVPAEFINRMKPWAAMMTLSTPPPVTGFYMDLSLSLRASGLGLEVVGLETLEQQLSFLENMPLEMQLSLLDQAIEEFHHVEQAHEQMVKVYLQNDLASLQALSDEQMNDVGREARDYFIEAGILERNRRMVAAFLPHLDTGRVFAAVGALHLYGEDGLVELLRRQGLELEPMPMPLAAKGAGAERQ